MRIAKAVAMVLVAAGLNAGCASAGNVTRSAADVLYQPVRVVVQNNAWSDVVVYALRGGHRFRVGTVSAANSASLQLRPDLLGPGGEVRLLARSIGGGGGYTSPSIYTAPGGTVTVNLEIDLGRSTVVPW